jgi:hypothetical protein
MQAVVGNQSYFRVLLNDRRSIPFLTPASTMSLYQATQNIQKHAARFNYSYLTMLGEYDEVVSNKLAARWHEKTPAHLEKELVVFD